MRTLLIAASLFACAPKANGGTVAAGPVEEGQAVAVFAGGCFWCIESDFDKVDGVISTTSGYTGGKEESPTYEDVGYHRTTHYEALRVVYDPETVTYDALLDYFFRHVDPTQDNGQFCDIGKQYRTAVFTDDPDEKKAFAKAKKAAEKELGQPVVTPLLPAATFWIAEEYHQDFYKKSPGRYHSYRRGCGRDARVKELWGGAH